MLRVYALARSWARAAAAPLTLVRDGNRLGSGAGQAAPVRVRGGLRAVRAARLAQDAADVVRRGVGADHERLADLAVREPARHELEHRDLARGEVVRRRVARGPDDVARAREQGDEAELLRERRR